MKVKILSTNTILTGIEGQIVKYNGCLPIWDGIPQKVQIFDLPASDINSMIMGMQMTDTLPYAPDLEPVNDTVIDLSSVFHPLVPKYQDKPGIYNVMITVVYKASGSNKIQTVYIPVMNIDSPNTRYRWRYFDTDFRYAVGERMGKIEPLAHTFDDSFWIDSRDWNVTYNVEAVYQDGSSEAFYLSQGDMIADACQYRQIKIKEPSGRAVVEKYYPKETSICGAITFRWLNSYGSYDAISCNNWSTQPTITQGLDGGTVTKRELTCVFELTEANKFALDVLSTSPDTLCIGLPSTSGWIKVRCSSTTGVKMTATGLVKTVTLKFQYL